MPVDIENGVCPMADLQLNKVSAKLQPAQLQVQVAQPKPETMQTQAQAQTVPAAVQAAGQPRLEVAQTDVYTQVTKDPGFVSPPPAYGPGTVQSSATWTDGTPEPGNHKFRVEIEGIEQTGFLECTGLGSSIEVIPYCNGTDPRVRKNPGKVSCSEVKLRWAVRNRDIYNWFKDASEGRVMRKMIAVVLKDRTDCEVARWHLFNAWPCAYEGPDLSATGTDIATESVTVTYERIERL